MYFPVYNYYAQVYTIDPNSKVIIGISKPFYNNNEITWYINMMNNTKLQFVLNYGQFVTYHPMYNMCYPMYNMCYPTYKQPSNMPKNTQNTQNTQTNQFNFASNEKKNNTRKFFKNKNMKNKFGNKKSRNKQVNFKFDHPTSFETLDSNAYEIEFGKRKSKKPKFEEHPHIEKEENSHNNEEKPQYDNEEIVYEEQSPYEENIKYRIMEEGLNIEDDDFQTIMNDIENRENIDDEKIPDSEEIEWDIVLERPKFEGMYLYKYGRGYLLKCSKEHPDYGKKYYHNAWWQNCNNGWFLRRENKNYFLENGAEFIFDDEYLNDID